MKHKKIDARRAQNKFPSAKEERLKDTEFRNFGDGSTEGSDSPKKPTRWREQHRLPRRTRSRANSYRSISGRKAFVGFPPPPRKLASGVKSVEYHIVAILPDMSVVLLKRWALPQWYRQAAMKTASTTAAVKAAKKTGESAPKCMPCPSEETPKPSEAAPTKGRRGSKSKKGGKVDKGKQAEAEEAAKMASVNAEAARVQAAFVAKAELAEGIRKGQRVSMRKSGAKATVSYIGPVSELEGDGIWLGVTFDDARASTMARWWKAIF